MSVAEEHSSLRSRIEALASIDLSPPLAKDGYLLALKDVLALMPQEQDALDHVTGEGDGGNNNECTATSAFLIDIEKVCRKHNLTLAHEDSHGAFLVCGFDAGNIEWLRAARDDRGEGEKD